MAFVNRLYVISKKICRDRGIKWGYWARKTQLNAKENMEISVISLDILCRLRYNIDKEMRLNDEE